ncbi:nucleoid-associated protein [Pantoea agglomerans]|uniref:nucleoid-associated protein n=1 Tax=Enterobacter agglomerans TaxID=549 RepID=UPI003015A733
MASIQVLNAIAVKIVPPEENQKDWSKTIGEPWPVDQEEVITFTTRVDARFHKSSKTHARFLSPYPQNSFPYKLLSHIKNEHSFKEFVSDFITNKLISSAKQSRASNGAILVFTHYKLENQRDDGTSEIQFERILVLMLKNADALRFKENLQLNPVYIIDLDKFLQGARVDLVRFRAELDEKDDEKNKNNLCFIRGSGELRQYFTKSIGADEIVSNKTSSEQVILAIESFAKEKDLGRPLKEKLESKVKELFDKCKKGHSISLEQIQIQIDSIIPVDKAEHKNKFVEYVNDTGFEVNEEFEILSSDKKKLEWLDIDTPIAKLSIKKHHIGRPDSDKPVKFNTETNEVTVVQKITDPDIIAKLSELADE